VNPRWKSKWYAPQTRYCRDKLSGLVYGLMFVLDSIEGTALNFAKTPRSLLPVTIEKVWNAVIDVSWKAISTATGLVLPIPQHS
jgi:hypothetical protein